MSARPAAPAPAFAAAAGRPARRDARGIGLVEVLLAVLLLSIGLLAAARMQVQGMTTSQNAYALSQAKLMVLEMGERMRANRAGVRAGLYDGLTTAPGTSAPACLDGGGDCSPAGVRDADLHAWSRHLHGAPGDARFVPLLPSAGGIEALGRVRRAPAGQTRIVSVEWAEVTADGAARRDIAVRVTP